MITVAILVKNGERKIAKTLSSVSSFDEVLLYDTGSTDSTLGIAQKFSNVKIVKGELNGFGPTRNLLSKLAKNDWILSIDADEELSKELAQEILETHLDESRVYAFRFKNYYKQQWIKGCGWYPETHVRLYNRGKTSFSELLIHEGVVTENLNIHTFNNVINHYTSDSIEEFIAKMQHYSTLFARQNKGMRKSSLGVAVGHGVAAFVKSYILKKGFLDGFAGFVISIYNGHTALYKYLKLREENKCS